MSKTDKTRPVRVKILDRRVEHHDHCDGVCELASDPARVSDVPGECTLTHSWWHREFWCGCSACTATWGTGRDPHRDRRRTRADLRRARDQR